MACPFFFPTQKSYTIAWAFPRRLPLGAGFCGHCHAAAEPHTPTDSELKDLCNVGYSHQCGRLPAERHADSLQFAVASDDGERVRLHYVYERDHAPVEHGLMEYDAAARLWVKRLDDACAQRQAECYLATYLERRPRAASHKRLPSVQLISPVK